MSKMDKAQVNYDLYQKYCFGDEKDEKRAYTHLILSAKQGHTEGQFYYGYLYMKNNSCQEDLVKGFTYCKLAADKGHIPAQYNVGICYSEGKGCEKDVKKGKRGTGNSSFSNSSINSASDIDQIPTVDNKFWFYRVKIIKNNYCFHLIPGSC